jgi:hypothetical protein
MIQLTIRQGYQWRTTVEAITGVFHSHHDTPHPIKSRKFLEAPAAMMLAWSLWLPRPILGLKETACGDDGAPAAMMLTQ